MSFQMARRRAAKPEPPPKPLLGTEVETRCSKCKTATKHVVIAKVGVKATRVRCAQCELEHEYRVVRPRRSVEAAAPQQTWAEAIARARGAGTAYAATDNYVVGARVSHATFGEGVVVRLASATVCEVLFESRTVKLLMRAASGGFVAPEPPAGAGRRRGRRF